MSPRSFARPVARLLRTKASRPMKSTAMSPNDPVSRAGQASANVTPVSSVRMSMRPGDIRHRGAERGERADHARRVGGCGIHPEVEVARGARTAMMREGVRPDDQEPDLSGDERAQQIDKVRVHRGSSRSTATARRTTARPA
jgi:hypothetical protein